MTTTLALAARLRELDDAALVALAPPHLPPARAWPTSSTSPTPCSTRDSVQRALAPLRPHHARRARRARRASATPLTADEVSRAARGAAATAGVQARCRRAALDDWPPCCSRMPARACRRSPSTTPCRAARRLAGASGCPRPAISCSAPPPPALAPVPDTERPLHRPPRRRARVRAVAAVSELLAELAREGARELQKGGLALPAMQAPRRRPLAHRRREPFAVALSVAARAGPVAPRGRGLAADRRRHRPGRTRPTPSAGAPSRRPGRTPSPPTCARILCRACPRRLGREPARATSPGCTRPAATSSARGDAYTRDAEWLGITAHQAPSSAGTALVEERPDAAAAAIGGALPGRGRPGLPAARPHRRRRPGRWRPASTRGCAAIADVESRALASTFRCPAAASTGRSPRARRRTSIRAFLSEISLTGRPAAARLPHHRRGRALRPRARARRRRAPDRGRARPCVSDDATLLRTIAVDQTLARSASCARRRTGWRAASPATSCSGRSATRATRSPPRTRRHEIVGARAGTGSRTPRRRRTTDAVAELVDAAARRQRPTTGDDTGEQWLARQLEAGDPGASTTVIVSVRMPDGTRRRLPAGADRRRRRPPARARPARRHRAHPAAVEHRRRAPRPRSGSTRPSTCCSGPRA